MRLPKVLAELDRCYSDGVLSGLKNPPPLCIYDVIRVDALDPYRSMAWHAGFAASLKALSVPHNETA